MSAPVPNAPSTQMFSVNLAGETIAETWNQAVPMPSTLAERNDMLEKQHHHSAKEMKARENKATENYKENLENISAKGHMESVKAESAKTRRAEFGENMTLMGNQMGNVENKIKLPHKLKKRIDALKQDQTTTSTLQSKQAKADANRTAALAAKKKKAKASTSKVAAAKARKAEGVRQQMESSGFYEVDVGGATDKETNQGGWNQTVPLPPKLAERVKQVNQQFDYDVMQRWSNTADNHQSKLNTIAAKGKIASERVAQAKQRRLLMKGDDMHFTVTTAGEGDGVSGKQGWAAKPILPPRLQSRLDRLNDGKGTVDPSDKQQRAALNRAACHLAIAKKGRVATEKHDAAKNRRAVAAGNATHFTVSEARFVAVADDAALAGETTVEAKHGWGTQQTTKMPSHLRARVAMLKKASAPEGSMASRQEQAALNRAALQRKVAMKASEETDKARAAQVQKKLMAGDKNTFTVKFSTTGDAADDAEANGHRGWPTKPRMPARLQARLKETTLKFQSKVSPATKQRRAHTNRARFHDSIRATAMYEQEKSVNAANRRELAAGDANTLFSVQDSDTSTAGWGSQSGVDIPAHLQDRLTSLKQEHQPRPHAERQAKADALRAAQLRAKQNKAAMETDKIHNAASRKALEAGDDRTFTCTFGDGEAAADNTSANGWKGSSRLPKRLSDRLKSLGETFQMQPYHARVANADKNRAAHLTQVQQKAGHHQDKAHAAQSRRNMATGDASHFTVAATDDADAVVQQQGWGYKPPMPARLQQRLNVHNAKKHANRDPDAKQAAARARRAQFHRAIAAKAKYETEKGLMAKNTKALMTGNQHVFTAQVDATTTASTGGWGVKVPLPARLEARYKALNAKFHGQHDPMAKQRNAAQLRADFNNAKVLKAHESVDRMLAAQSRKSLQEGNEACFRVEFAPPDQADQQDQQDQHEQPEQQPGWGKTSPTLPKRLAARAAALLANSPTKNPFEAMQKATENRDAYLSALVAKAHQTSVKMEAARQRKFRQEMDAGIVLINTANQREMSPVKLPRRLSERVEALTSKFGYDGAEKEKRVEENRQRRLNEIRAKAAAGATRAAAAKERRRQMARQQQLARIQNPEAAAVPQAEEEVFGEEGDGCAKKTRNSCTVC